MTEEQLAAAQKTADQQAAEHWQVVDGVLVFDGKGKHWERDKPIYPTGQIELQNHGNTLYFRNIFIKEL